MNDHVKARGCWGEDGKVHLDDSVRFHAQLRRLDLGAGEAVVVRVEREADAKRHHQLKWYYGYIVKQCVKETGYSVVEMDLIFRALFMPGDVETLSLMSYEQMADFNTQCEAYAAQDIGVVIEGPLDSRRYAA